MPSLTMSETPIQFGEGGRLFGMLSVPGERDSFPENTAVFVFLNAGLLHRVGPSRLHVRLARKLARQGLSSLRVDLAGKGDSPARDGLTNQESVAADFEDIKEVLQAYFRDPRLVLVGLCSGADNAIRLAISESSVVGMLLLDPICFRDAGFHYRALRDKYLDPWRYLDWLRRRIARARGASEVEQAADPLALRDLPSLEQVRASFAALHERDGRVLSLFTRYATRYYNEQGQLARILSLPQYGEFARECFWPDSEHTYKTEIHRARLIDTIADWATIFSVASATSVKMGDGVH
jgi:hypothetical protein